VLIAHGVKLHTRIFCASKFPTAVDTASEQRVRNEENPSLRNMRSHYRLALPHR
jgi:hypothetical protein